MDDKQQDDGLIPVEQAAADLGISLPRFLGYCMDRRPWMPISDGKLVQADSLDGLRKHLLCNNPPPNRGADHSSEVAP
jgi:hypothetical protein